MSDCGCSSTGTCNCPQGQCTCPNCPVSITVLKLLGVELKLLMLSDPFRSRNRVSNLAQCPSSAIEAHHDLQ
ncbi:hypothetical protein N657DRAFT_647770 [Parathielavia appendiculata]|uniref:Metallothionein n=1 Tax=Parathielavia appendiculata TaxID=2587402 RepID=A0AAN6TW43_9PEZI|nr:hypothetical protein N657DRAFT_647770 [Parathielavia appendiculata]